MCTNFVPNNENCRNIDWAYSKAIVKICGNSNDSASWCKQESLMLIYFKETEIRKAASKVLVSSSVAHVLHVLTCDRESSALSPMARVASLNKPWL